MPQEKLQPFHRSILLLIPNATAQEMSIFAHILHVTLIPESSRNEILHVWKHRRQEIKCDDHGITTLLSSARN